MLRYRLFLVALLMPWSAATAQRSSHADLFKPGEHGSRNIKVLSHLPLGRMFTVSDVELEQELSRPYAYVSRMHGSTNQAGFTIVDVKNPEKARAIYTWRIENPELHKGYGGLGPAYLKIKGRYYFAQSFQFTQGSPDADLGAIVFDVTGLPDTTKIREVGRIKSSQYPGGFHEIYAYKHSDGRALLFTTVFGNRAHVYDIEKLAAGDANAGLIGPVPVPPDPNNPLRGYHDFYVGFDPATKQDKFYGAGNGGYYVYDVTRPEEPKLITSVTGVSGIQFGHTFTPTPDGRYAVAEVEYQYAPLRIFDLKPGLDGTVKTVSRPIGAVTPRWQGLPHNHEVRWPYVFVSGYEDGLWVFNMMDPTNPYIVAYYDTYDGPHEKGWGGAENPEGVYNGTLNRPNATSNGAFGQDIRNADGLIVISDMTTGFWAFKLEGFDGWNGHQWGMPNISSAQDWDNGPDGAPKPTRVS
jgi:hypothetical protein